jgi:hypothetical protein
LSRVLQWDEFDFFISHSRQGPPEDKLDKCVFLADDRIREKGYLVLGTFSKKGPKACSGLEIKQCSETSMAARFEFAFGRIKCLTEDHATPFGTVQNLLFCGFKKR